MSADPRVSVIMPVYNSELFLSEAVESVLGQTFADFELILIDDGSTDNSPGLISDYKKKDGRIRVLTNECNSGTAVSRIKGLEVARGEYIACLDSDDVALPDRFEKQVSYLENRPGFGLIGSDLLIIDEFSNVVGKRIYPHSDSEIRKVMLRFNPVANPTTMMRASIARAAGGYRVDAYLVEDYDLFIRVAELSSVSNLPEELVKYRITGSQLKATHLNGTLAGTLKIQREAVARGMPDTLTNKLFRTALKGVMLLPNRFILWLFKTFAYKSL